MGNFRVLTDGTNSLRVESSPIYWAALFFLVVAAISFLALSGSLLGGNAQQDRIATLNGVTLRSSALRKGWKLPTGAALLLLLSGYAAFSLFQASSLSIYREKQQFSIDLGYGLLGHSKVEGPISSIGYATLETDAAAQRFVVVMKDGERVGLGPFTDQGGQSEAVAAVSTFLNVGPNHE